MKSILIQPLIFPYYIFLLGFLALPALLHAGSTMPEQNISISFDLNNGILTGHSVITLPPDMPLRIFLADLENVQAVLNRNNVRQTLDIDEQRTIAIPALAREQTISFSWQISAAQAGHGSNNLISKEGITLAGFWHPAAETDMLFSLTAELPGEFSGISEGDKLPVSVKDGKRFLKAEFPHPVQSINFAAGPYTVRSRTAGKTKIYTYFFEEDSRLAAGYLNKAATYIKRYEKLIGPFPYKRYSIVENRLPTGYGMPGFTLLGQAVIRLPFIKDTSLGHEILHSWFGNALRTDASGNWCEGLTTYLADQSYAQDNNADIPYRKNQIMRYQSYVHDDNIIALIDFQHGGDSQAMAKKMRAIGYDKGSMFFHMLRREIGDKPFFATLRQLYAEKKYQVIGWTDLETAFSKNAGRNLSLFFGQWLLRNDIPQLSAEDVAVEQKQGQSVISFRLVQDNKDPYRLQVPVVVKTLRQKIQKNIQVDTPDQLVSVTVDSLPTELLIDPDYDLMRSLQVDERSPSWIEFMGAEQKTVVLPGKEDMERYLPLVASMERMGCTLVKASELKNSTLGDGNYLFLDSSSHTLGLFGKPDYPAEGFTLDVRKNPLNQNKVMILVSSSSTEETASVIRKLSHYGKYSYLHFLSGKIQNKRITPSTLGIRIPLLPPAAGIPVRQVEGFTSIIDEIMDNRVIYLGEMHTDYGSHLLQLQVIQALYEKNPNLAIGMEMFPRSSQQALDDYINGTTTDEKDFLNQSKYFKVWGYDYRMYRDIIGYAKKHRIPLVGLNLDKEIVSTVFSKGSTDELSKEQIAQVAAERDVDLPGYRKRLTAVHAVHNNSPHGSNFNGFLQAQSMWDETMAESIVNYLQAHPDRQMVVIAGTGHVYKDSAIPPRVARRMNVRQSVLISDNGVDRGLEKGRKLDYLMFTRSIELPPAGKIGVILEEVKASDEVPAYIKIIRISPHGKAGQAGLMEDDTILKVDGYSITTIGDLKAGLMDKDPGDTVKLNIRRKNKNLDIEVELSNMERSGMMMPPGHPEK
jgi:uncharacterized iron-regulated protein